jgi:F-type H+-transporting ATPase subunit b
MRASRLAALLLVATASPLLAAPAGAENAGLMAISTNLMFWTILIFVVLYVILNKFAFPAIIGAVEAREQSLQASLDAARADREEAARLLAEHRALIEGSRGDAQKLIAEGRATAEKLRNDLLEQTRVEQQDMLARARREIEGERDRAIAQMRREAVDLAIAGASRVIEQNLDSAGNRALVESYLGSVQGARIQ